MRLGQRTEELKRQKNVLSVVTIVAFDTKRDDALRLKRLRLKNYNYTTNT